MRVIGRSIEYMNGIAYSGRVEEMTPHFLDVVHRITSPSSDSASQIMRAGPYRPDGLGHSSAMQLSCARVPAV